MFKYKIDKINEIENERKRENCICMTVLCILKSVSVFTIFVLLLVGLSIF